MDWSGKVFDTLLAVSRFWDDVTVLSGQVGVKIGHIWRAVVGLSSSIPEPSAENGREGTCRDFAAAKILQSTGC